MSKAFGFDLELALVPRLPYLADLPEWVTSEQVTEALDQLARIFNSGYRCGYVTYEPDSKTLCITYPRPETHTFVDS